MKVIFVTLLGLFALSVYGDDVESHAFDAEISRILDIIINSLYKTKEIFLRELVSNASDACDKSRIMSLTRPSYYGGDSLNITISANKTNNEFIIQDTGIGMTKDEMITNLGTIAKSGTKAFLESLGSNAADSNLIGQFGLGFYSAFLVADKVTVISKRDGGVETAWSCSSNEGKYMISASEGHIPGTQGTKIILHVKPDVDDNDYFETSKIKELIVKYSSHIKYPIYLLTEKAHHEDVPIEDASEEKSASEEDKLKVEDTPKEEKPKTKVVTTYTHEWERANTGKSVLTSKPKDITEEEYNKYYTDISSDTKAPLYHIHSTVNGKYTEIRSLLYIPAKASFQPFSKDEPFEPVSLYLKRVLISALDKLPRWASFIKGVVDVDSVPLNVSRETLQKHKCLEEIENTIVTKTLAMMDQMARNETLYTTFYKEYSGHIKLGILSEDKDEKRRKHLTHLLRYHTNVSGARNFTSLADYCTRMKSNQTDIYFVTGSKLSEMKKLPYVEKVKKRGYEVVYMNEPFDEYVVQSMPSYTPPGSETSYNLKNIAKGGLTFADETEDEKQMLKDAADKFKPLMDYLKNKFSKKIEKVSISNLLEESPMAVVANSFGWSPEMKRMMRDNKNDPMAQFFSSQKEILEINPNHSVMQVFLDKVSALGEGAQLPSDEDAILTLLFNSALLHSGHDLDDRALFANQVENLVRDMYKMEPKPAPEPSAELDEEEEPAMPDFSSMMNGLGDLGDMPMPSEVSEPEATSEATPEAMPKAQEPIEKDEL